MQSSTKPFARPIARVAWRVRLQRVLETTCSLGCLLLLALTGTVFALKARLISPQTFGTTMAISVLVLALCAIWQLARPIAAGRIAKRLDDTHGLHDRISSALEFGALAEPSPFQRAQVAEALTHLPAIEPSRAAPFRRPKDLGPFGAIALCLGAVVLLRFPEPKQPIVAPPPPLATLGVSAEELSPHRSAARELAADASRHDLPELRALSERLVKLLDQLERKELTRKQLLTKLAALEAQMRATPKTNLDQMLAQLRKAAKELKRDKPTQALAETLKHGDLRAAKKEMERLAKQLDKLRPKERQRLANNLKRASAHQPTDKALQRAIERARRHLRRLQKQQRKRPHDANLKRRLARKTRPLQRLNQQLAQQQAQNRQLQRLNRQLAAAAQALLNKLDPKQRKALEALMKAAQQLQRFANELTKRQMMAKAQDNLQDLKEFLRRLGQGGKIRVGRLADFMRRARGQQGKGKGKGQGKGKGKGKGNDMLLVPGSGRAGAGLQLPGQGQPGQGQPGQGQPGQGQPGQGQTGQDGSANSAQSGQSPGQGQGHGTDPNLRGERTRLASRRRAVFVAGQEGKGPSRSEVIYGAADRGFSTQTYGRVYHDYRRIVEDVMKREQVPLGYRYYVKRYFQLIKPR